MHLTQVLAASALLFATSTLWARIVMNGLHRKRKWFYYLLTAIMTVFTSYFMLEKQNNDALNITIALIILGGYFLIRRDFEHIKKEGE